MHRIYFILIAVILGIGSLFLFWSPEPAKRKQRRALEKPMVASMEVPKEKPRVEEPVEDVEAPPAVAPRELEALTADPQSDLTFEQGYCEARMDPLETQWLRDVRSTVTKRPANNARMAELAAEFESVESPQPRHLMAQSIVLRKLDRFDDAAQIEEQLPGPQPSRLQNLVEQSQDDYRAGRFRDAIENLNTHRSWTLGKVLYLPFLSRLELTEELTRDFTRRRGDGYTILHPAEADSKDWSEWEDQIESGLDDLAEFIEAPLPKPLTLIVFRDRSELLATTCGKNWAGGIYDGIVKLFLNEDGSLPSTRTVHHELVHALLERSFKFRAPLWFEEGLAEVFEHRAKPLDPGFSSLLKSRVYVPISTLNDGFNLLEDGPEANAAYLQSRALILWLQQDNGTMSLGESLELLNGATLSREDFTDRVLGSDFSMEIYFQFLEKLSAPK